MLWNWCLSLSRETLNMKNYTRTFPYEIIYSFNLPTMLKWKKLTVIIVGWDILLVFPHVLFNNVLICFCLVAALIYWRDPKKSGIVFGTILGVLLSLAYFSLISVLAYMSLLALSGTILFRIYKTVLQAVQKTSDGHPFKWV